METRSEYPLHYPKRIELDEDGTMEALNSLREGDQPCLPLPYFAESIPKWEAWTKEHGCCVTITEKWMELHPYTTPNYVEEIRKARLRERVRLGYRVEALKAASANLHASVAHKPGTLAGLMAQEYRAVADDLWAQAEAVAKKAADLI